MPRDTHGHSAGAQTALSTSYTAIEIKDVTGTDARADQVPNQCMLGWLHGEIDTIAASAASITWFVALDSGGDIPLTEELTETIKTGETTATDGAVVSIIERPYSLFGNGTQGSLWVFAKTDTGTCNITPRLTWSRQW